MIKKEKLELAQSCFELMGKNRTLKECEKFVGSNNESVSQLIKKVANTHGPSQSQVKKSLALRSIATLLS